MKKTKIEWCDSTWSPVTGCLHGCEYCYARRIANRFSYTKDWAVCPENLELEEPVIDGLSGRVQAYPHGFAPTFHRYKLDEPQRWTKSRNVFVCSMADLFGSWVPDEWIEEVFAACEKAPQHNYLFLTKNNARYMDLIKNKKLPKSDNFWYGTTVTSQNDEFYHSNMRNTFLSIEPLLQPFQQPTKNPLEYMDWVIIGAETGNRKGKIIPEKAWIDEIVGFCDSYKTPVFMKNSLVPIVGEENMRRDFPWE